MAMTSEDFQTRFSSLSGVTIGERRKNLFVLLSSLNEETINSINFSTLQTKTYLEEKFKLDILLRFRKIPQLFELLKSENSYVFDKILRLGPTFIREVFRDVSGQYLVDVIFPSICLKAKLKLVNKLADHFDNESRADEYFHCVSNTYDLHLAFKLISACSVNTILTYLSLHKIKLTPRQIIRIYRRHPEIIGQVLDYMHKNNVDFHRHYEVFFMYVSKKDILLFLELNKKYKLNLKVGRRVTNKFLQVKKKEVIREPKDFCKTFHATQIVKTLRNDLSTLLLNSFPVNYKTAYWNTDFIFSKLPRKVNEVTMYLRMFEKRYGFSAWDHPSLLNEEILMRVPVEERLSKIQINNKPEHFTEEKWYSYFQTDVSIPYYKKRIANTSDIYTRVTLIGFLVVTCKLNKDKVALANVCKYMVKQHRNDHVSVRGKFLRVLNDEFNLKELEEVHWTSINELIEIYEMNKENFNQENDYLSAYIYFCMSKGLPFKELFTDLMKTCCRHQGLNIYQENPRFEKQCILLSLEIAKDVLFKDDKRQLEQYYMDFINAMLMWNKRHPEDKFNLLFYSDILKALKERYEKKSIAGMNVLIQYFLENYYDNEITKDLLLICLFTPKRNITTKTLNWLIRYKPTFIREHIEIITHFAVEKLRSRYDCYFWFTSKNYSHLEVPQRMIPILLEKIGFIESAALGLSCLMPTTDYLQVASSYYPTGLKADPKTEEGQKQFRTQQHICKFLKCLYPASLTWECILVFCKGDYLKIIQSALYSVSDTTNEDKLLSLLQKLSDSAVSVRKHVSHLSFRLLNARSRNKILEEFIKAEKNVSICKFLFKGAFNLFLKNPNDESWQLVKLTLANVDHEDQEAFQILMSTSKVPQIYAPQYITFVWDYLDKFPNPNKSWVTEKVLLLTMVTPKVIRQLSPEFCESIINKYLFKSEDSSLSYILSHIQAFTCKFIIYAESPSLQVTRLSRYFNLLKEYSNGLFSNRHLKANCRNYVGNFLKEFCRPYLQEGCTDKALLLKFVDAWNELVPPYYCLKEYLHLQFVLMFVDQLPFKEFCEKVIALYDFLVESYGTVVLNELNKQLKFFESYFIKDVDVDGAKLLLCQIIIELDNTNVSHLMLVAQLLASMKRQHDENLRKYNLLIETLFSSPDQSFQIFLSNVLEDTTTLNYNY